MRESPQRLWQVYSPEIPEFLRRFAATPPVQRLRLVGMNCGCEYTAFPRFAAWAPYSRFDHSVGVGLIVWHFTGDIRQAVAGLLHDIATPPFAHAVDFLAGDHLQQEATEGGTEALIRSSPELRSLLAEFGLTWEQVSDYHRYPIADNPSPQLSADRLEYTLGDLLSYGLAEIPQLQSFYGDLEIRNNEHGIPELAFQTPETGLAFTEAALSVFRIYVAEEDRFSMQALADLLRLALERGALDPEDLRGTEPAVIQKLEADPACSRAWNRFCAYHRLLQRRQRPERGYWVQVPAKLRYIDPLVSGAVRASQLSPRVRSLLEDFRQTDFSHWLSAE